MKAGGDVCTQGRSSLPAPSTPYRSLLRQQARKASAQAVGPLARGRMPPSVMPPQRRAAMPHPAHAAVTSASPPPRLWAHGFCSKAVAGAGCWVLDCCVPDGCTAWQPCAYVPCLAHLAARATGTRRSMRRGQRTTRAADRATRMRRGSRTSASRGRARWRCRWAACASCRIAARACPAGPTHARHPPRQKR